MVRTKESHKGKEKAGESSSRSRSKRARNTIVLRERSEEESAHESEEELGPIIWKKPVRLSSFPYPQQKDLYMDKVKSPAGGFESLFTCEKQIHEPNFERYGVVNYFRRLGWEESLAFHYDGIDDVYGEAILEWMATLQRIEGDNPPQTTILRGTVNGKQADLSFQTIDKIAHFDSGAENNEPYEYVSDDKLKAHVIQETMWENMIRTLFVVDEGCDVFRMILRRDMLKPLPKLLLVFVTLNVVPRTGDKTKVRFYEVMVLHALLTGSLVMSSKHLIMCNIWESREERERMVIPHCRLLSKFLKWAKVLPRRPAVLKIKHKPYTLRSLQQGSWRYELTARTHVLTDTTTARFLEELRSDVSEEEEMNLEDEEVGPTGPTMGTSGAGYGFEHGFGYSAD
ncbi:hypothetical protein L1987_02610 [Smallanthus sonchifolius]|uniref:Uncharacterized protein n=1 Tax=Smallanthus sonchifolius TaxID=185202 RepID=A0ACB9K8B4_9ASTR|nr:hypothetical protein L1987_02610 [Smallanthus sonchifolius]